MYLNEDAIAVDVSNQSSVLVYSVDMDQKRAPLHKTVQKRLGLLAKGLGALRCIHAPIGDRNEKCLSEIHNHDNAAGYRAKLQLTVEGNTIVEGENLL